MRGCIRCRMQKQVAEISLRAVAENATYFRRLTKKKLCAVVKDDAYGHGAAEVVAALSAVADAFAVANADEAVQVLCVTDKDVLVLTPPCSIDEAEEIAVRGAIATVDGLECAYAAAAAAKTLNKSGERLRVHIKANTGMNRYGACGEEFVKTCEVLKNASGVFVEGIYSHLSDATDRAFCEEQRELFDRCCRTASGYFPKLTRHLAATGGCAIGERYYFDMVRVGLGLYGYTPEGLQNFPLEIAMKAYGRVVNSRIYEGGRVGYGKEVAKKGDDLHVVNVGYGGGFFRRKENGLSGGANAAMPCMDATIRYGKRELGERVLLMDDARKTAAACGTIVYEVLCSVGSRAERVYES